MHINKKPRIVISLCLILLMTVFSAGMFAFAHTNQPVQPTLSATPFDRMYLDRLNLHIDATQFVFMIDERGKYAVQFEFTAEKTEPDFYAVLDSFYLFGMPYSEMTVTAASENGDIVAIQGAQLPSDYNGNTQSLKWTIELIFETPQSVTYEPVLHLQYTSGTKYELSESYRLEIPLLFKVCDLAPLPQVMQEAETYFTLGIYTEESLARLRNKLDEIEYELRSPIHFNEEQKNTWLREIADCISALMPL